MKNLDVTLKLDFFQTDASELCFFLNLVPLKSKVKESGNTAVNKELQEYSTLERNHYFLLWYTKELRLNFIYQYSNTWSTLGERLVLNNAWSVLILNVTDGVADVLWRVSRTLNGFWWNFGKRDSVSPFPWVLLVIDRHGIQRYVSPSCVSAMIWQYEAHRNWNMAAAYETDTITA